MRCLARGSPVLAAAFEDGAAGFVRFEGSGVGKSPYSVGILGHVGWGAAH